MKAIRTKNGYIIIRPPDFILSFLRRVFDDINLGVSCTFRSEFYSKTPHKGLVQLFQQIGTTILINVILFLRY